MARKRVWDRDFLKGLVQPGTLIEFTCDSAADARSLRFALYREAQAVKAKLGISITGRTLYITAVHSI